MAVKDLTLYRVNFAPETTAEGTKMLPGSVQEVIFVPVPGQQAQWSSDDDAACGVYISRFEGKLYAEDGDNTTPVDGGSGPTCFSSSSTDADRSPWREAWFSTKERADAVGNYVWAAYACGVETAKACVTETLFAKLKY